MLCSQTELWQQGLPEITRTYNNFVPEESQEMDGWPDFNAADASRRGLAQRRAGPVVVPGIELGKQDSRSIGHAYWHWAVTTGGEGLVSDVQTAKDVQDGHLETHVLRKQKLWASR